MSQMLRQLLTQFRLDCTKCIDLAVNVYGISVGLNVTTGKYDIKRYFDDAVKNIEGCVKGAYLKLYPNG